MRTYIFKMTTMSDLNNTYPFFSSLFCRFCWITYYKVPFTFIPLVTEIPLTVPAHTLSFSRIYVGIAYISLCINNWNFILHQSLQSTFTWKFHYIIEAVLWIPILWVKEARIREFRGMLAIAKMLMEMSLVQAHTLLSWSVWKRLNIDNSIWFSLIHLEIVKWQHKTGYT